ncbi:sugar porter family MFS transporter [Corynebacterium pacaense]|uniref:sugar porter family MFS transporter n=1 Tax=Corynebacterium pacaense TaxID=1816684 RepID=UPI0009BBFBFA|nr:sugar porter family MFS transporter [Corynebacterium pacaense]
MTDTKSPPTIKNAAPVGKKQSRRLGQISLVACLGGLLFGYDTGVTNGAEGHMATEMGLDLLQLGVVISSLVFAAAVGALIAGRISDAIGRRPTIIMLSILFFVGTIFVITAPAGELGQFNVLGFSFLVFGRILLGIAVGGASTVVPVYLAELAPYEIRGSITGRNELAIVSGQLAAFVINAIIAVTLHGVITGLWRIMFAVCALPAIALFIGMLRMPESPRWLVNNHREDEALDILRTVRTEERAHSELLEIQESAVDHAGAKKNRFTLKEIISSKWLVRIILIGTGVAVAQQLTGINAIMYYGVRVLEESGMSEEQSVIANIAFGVVAVLGGLFALRNMDRLDRRITFVAGLSLTTTFHVLIAIFASVLPEGNALRPYVILVLVIGFVLSMQSFLNVAVWVWLAEVFPQQLRGTGIGVSVFFGWTANGILALTFPSLVSGVGITSTFIIFAVVGVVALAFVATMVPETRGRSLEDLEEGIFSGEIFNRSRA